MSIEKVFKPKNLVILGLITFSAGSGLFWWSHSDHYAAFTSVQRMGKSYVPIQVEIKAPTGIPKSADETTELEAVVHQFTDMGDEPVTYHWQLPEGVVIQSGELSGVILGLNQNAATLTISVKGLSPEVQESIFLDLNTDMNGQSVAAQGVFSTYQINPDLSVSPRQPASEGWFGKAQPKPEKRGLPPKGVHF